MNIVILSRGPKLYSTKRLKEEAAKRGHKVKVVNPLHCYMNISHNDPTVFYKGEALKDIDAVIPRIGASVTFYASAVLRQFEMMGVFGLNDSVAINRSRDKLRALQLLSRKGVPMPVTGFAHNARRTRGLIDMVGGAPLILKLLSGTQGKGVVLAETKKAAESVIGAFQGLKTYFLVQEFIKDSPGTDYRAFVIGDKVVASFKRQAQGDEFRSNLHLGGSGEKAKITPEERAMCIKATKAMGLKVAGVDFLRSSKGPLIMEVNSSPGLEGIEKYTGKNVAEKIISYIERNARPETTTRGVRG